MEEEDLVVDAVVPVLAVVTAGAFDVVVVDLHRAEFLVEGTVHIQEEVVDAAIEDDLLVAVVKAVGDVDDSIFFPVVFVVGEGTQVFFDAPVVGEGADVDAAAGGAAGAEEIFVTEAQEEAAVAAHAKAGDGAVFAVGLGGIVAVDIGDEFFYDEGFVADGGIEGRVEVPAVKAAVGADEEDIVFVCALGKLGGERGPLGVVAAMTVEKVDDGPFGGDFFRMDDNDFDVFVHCGAMDEDGVCRGGASDEAVTAEQECEKFFHNRYNSVVNWIAKLLKNAMRRIELKKCLIRQALSDEWGSCSWIAGLTFRKTQHFRVDRSRWFPIIQMWRFIKKAREQDSRAFGEERYS